MDGYTKSHDESVEVFTARCRRLNHRADQWNGRGGQRTDGVEIIDGIAVLLKRVQKNVTDDSRPAMVEGDAGELAERLAFHFRGNQPSGAVRAAPAWRSHPSDSAMRRKECCSCPQRFRSSRSCGILALHSWFSGYRCVPSSHRRQWPCISARLRIWPRLGGGCPRKRTGDGRNP